MATATTLEAPVTEAEAPTLTVPELAAQLKERFTELGAQESSADAAWKAAKIAWENFRVIRSRIAYEAAMLVPYQGKANIKGAARVLLSEDYGVKAADDAAVKAKNSIAPYVTAGIALFEAGLVSRITEPDEAERKIVADVFRAHNTKAPKQDKSTAEPEGAPSEPEVEPEDSEAFTFLDVLGHLARAKASLSLLKAQGYAPSQEEADELEDALAQIAASMTEALGE